MFLDRRFFFIVYLYTQVVTETKSEKVTELLFFFLQMPYYIQIWNVF